MQEPANMPRLVTCHELEMKHESTVFQFQSICGARLLSAGLSIHEIVFDHGKRG